MKRLWRSVIILALCFFGVIGLQIYLSQKVDLAKTAPSDGLPVEVGR